jgi:hypothetical protein
MRPQKGVPNFSKSWEERMAISQLKKSAPRLQRALIGLVNCHTGAKWQTVEVQRVHWVEALAALAESGWK